MAKFDDERPHSTPTRLAMGAGLTPEAYFYCCSYRDDLRPFFLVTNAFLAATEAFLGWLLLDYTTKSCTKQK